MAFSLTPRGIWRGTDYTPISSSTDYAYRISYVPPRLDSGECHHVKVTVDRRDAEVLATDQYCYIPQLALRSLFPFKRYRIAALAAREYAAVNFAPDYVPLVSQEIQITPTADPTFERKEP